MSIMLTEQAMAEAIEAVTKLIHDLTAGTGLENSIQVEQMEPTVANCQATLRITCAPIVGRSFSFMLRLWYAPVSGEPLLTTEWTGAGGVTNEFPMALKDIRYVVHLALVSR